MKVLSIGRDDDCNIILADTMISRRHAILKIHATGKMEIVDMGQNGTYVNGIKLSSNVPYPVSRKDVISFAHKKRLDWSQVPDNFRIYRYVMLCFIIVAFVTGMVFLVRHITITPETQPDAGTVNTPVEEVITPTVPIEKPKKEGEQDVTPKDRNKKGDIKYVLPEEKKNKKEDENKENKVEAEEPPEETMPLL